MSQVQKGLITPSSTITTFQSTPMRPLITLSSDELVGPGHVHVDWTGLTWHVISHRLSNVSLTRSNLIKLSRHALAVPAVARTINLPHESCVSDGDGRVWKVAVSCATMHLLDGAIRTVVRARVPDDGDESRRWTVACYVSPSSVYSLSVGPPLWP